MREKLETLSLIQLREIAKLNGIKSVTTYRKPDLINKLVELSDKQVPSSSSDPAAESSEPANSGITSSSCSTSEQTSSESVSDETASQPEETESSETTEATEATETSSSSESSVRFPSYYRKNHTQQDTPRSPKYPSSGNYTNRSYQPSGSRFAAPKDNTPPSNGGYVRRNGGYAQAYNPISPEISSTRPPRPYRPYQDDTAASEPIPASSPALTPPSAPPTPPYAPELASNEPAHGIIELTTEGYGFLRCENYLSGSNDVYVSPAQIRKFNMRTGDMIDGVLRVRSGNEKNAALLYVNSINGFPPSQAESRPQFEDLTPIYPTSRLSLESKEGPLSLRILDLLCPLGKGQRGMIVSPPKAGKTTLLKDIAKAITANHPDIKMIILLIDERPEEVTDIKESLEGRNVEVIYSTFDKQPDNHKAVAEKALERAKRLVEHKQDVVILLDSITRLARAYNMIVTPTGRTLSGGLDPASLYMPKKFFGAARNMREGGSLTILATALVDTGSRMDDVIFEEFKGTGNMEIVLDRRLSERRIFPAIDISRSGTRREDLLLSPQELEAVTLIRKNTSSSRSDDMIERILSHFAQTENNQEFIDNLSNLHLS